MKMLRQFCIIWELEERERIYTAFDTAFHGLLSEFYRIIQYAYE